MCEFVSFIVLAEDGLKILANGRLNDHSTIVSDYHLTGKNYYEVEWTGEDPDDLYIRSDTTTSESEVEAIRQWITKQFKTRSRLIEYLLKGVDFSEVSLDLSDTNVRRLPENFTVGRFLNLARTSIKKLPAGLKVGGKLDLHNSDVTSLPDNLTVGGSIDLSGCKGLKKLPKGLKFAADLQGYLDITNTGITSLPDDLNYGAWGEIYTNFPVPGNPRVYPV